MSSDPSTPTLGQVVGRNFAAFRAARGWTQEIASRMLQAQGLDWSAAQIASLESGRREDLTVSDLLKLSLALEVSLASWYAGAGRASLDKPGAAKATRGELRAVRALFLGKAPDDAISK